MSSAEIDYVAGSLAKAKVQIQKSTSLYSDQLLFAVDFH
jgi:hypothetical protein